MNAEGQAVSLLIEPVAMTCGSCYMTFAVPMSFYRKCRDEGASFRCPNPGCQWRSQSYTRSAVQELEAKLATEKARAERAISGRRWAETQAEQAERRRRAAKGQVTKIRNRLAGGLCPCCNQRFADLAEHMASEHPEMVPGAEGAA